MVYLSLEKKEFTPEKIKKYNEEAITEIGEEDGKDTLIISTDGKGRFEEIDEFSIMVVEEDPKFGYVSIDVNLSADDILNLVEIAVKKLNKYKAMIESLK